jgi:hypothetical protein
MPAWAVHDDDDAQLAAAAPQPCLSSALPLPPLHAHPCQVHNRLKGYVKSHFEHQLKCVEKGLIDPYSG